MTIMTFRITMRRLIPVVFLAAVAAGTAADSLHWPVFPQDLLELQARTQVIASLDNLDLLAEGVATLQDADLHLQYKAVTLGAYYRVLPNLKLGLFDRLQSGARHDDDVQALTSGPTDWAWADTTNRWENVLMLDASPRFQLGAPGSDTWVFMLKNRLIWNMANNDLSFMTRPELTWFWIVDRVPLLNVALSYETYAPLNFGSTPVYQSYPYLSVLWHATPEIGIELAGAPKATVWSTSESWAALSGWSQYSETVRSWTISLGAVITLTF
jgi:hypothetical protein